MSCSWLYLASRTTPERFCGKPGHPYCPEHQREMDAMEQVDKDWDEILATHEALCEEPKEEQQLCAICNRRPVHDGCIYCEECCADDALNLLGPQASSETRVSPAPGTIFAFKGRIVDTIDIKIDVPAPPREEEQEIARMFVEKATRAGAINARILKKNGDWTYVAEFIDPEKAWLYADGLAKAMGTVLKVDIKPTSNDAEN